MTGTLSNRNIVICCDGTNNKFGRTVTNVVRLVQALRHDPERQLVYYDPGVGTMPDPGVWSGLAKAWTQLLGLGFGAGLVRNVDEAYRYLMDTWQPGDRIYLFGFSRGAYTVRVLAGLLWQMGLLRRGQGQLVPYAIRQFRAAPTGKSDQKRNEYFRICDRFRNTFAAPTGRDDKRFETHFVGVWDTVSAVGWIWTPKRFPYTAENSGILAARHAIALDERRSFYRANRIKAVRATERGAAPRLVERWFPGVHSDVGGGYDDSGGALWREAFDWMVTEATALGLHFEAAPLAKIREHPAQGVEPWSEPKHESLDWKWWLAEFLPKVRYSERFRRTLPSMGLFTPRPTKGATLHESVLHRIRGDQSYRPPNLPRADLETILSLPTVAPGATHTID